MRATNSLPVRFSVTKLPSVFARDAVGVSPAYRAWVLVILVVVYAFNFIDRQIVGILAEPIRTELQLTDTELSLLGGLAFAMFYTVLGIPVALLADRNSRSWIMTVSLALWSGMTALCGLATSFTHIFLARIGVGIGEAGGTAPAYSLLADYFPPHQRGRAMSIYAFGIPVGAAIGIVLGGILTTQMGWRYAFILIGLLGVGLAPILKLTLREPRRGQYDAPTARVDPAPLADVIKTLRRKPSFWLLAVGGATTSMMGYGLLFWLPSFFIRSFGADLPGFFAWLPAGLVPEGAGAVLYASYFYGTIIFVGGLTGIGLGGYFADRFGRRHKGAYAMVPAIALTATLPLLLVGVLSKTLVVTYIVFMAVQAFSWSWLGPVTSAFQHLVPPNMRATASATFLFINNLIGLALGNLVIGLVSDSLAAEFGAESLRYAILTGTGFYGVAAVLMFAAAKRLKYDWE